MFLELGAGLAVLAVALAFSSRNPGFNRFQAVEQEFGNLARKPGRSGIVVVLAILAFVLIRALPNLSYPLGRDQATFAVIAQGLLHGKLLYRDLWDMKPPGIFYLYAPFLALWGNAWWLVGLIDILWLLAFSYVLYRFAKPFVGEFAAAMGVVVYACWHCRAGYVVAGQPEDFITLFVVLAYLAMPRGSRWVKLRLLAAGLLLGAAFWLKYNAGTFLLLLAFVPYVQWKSLDSSPVHFRLRIPVRKWLRHVAVLVAGLILAAGLVLALLAAGGLWTTFWRDHVEILLRYGVSPIRREHSYWQILIVYSLHNFGISLIAAAIALKVAGGRKELSGLVPVCLAAAIGYATGASQVHLAPYTFVTFSPFLALIWGYLAARACEKVWRTWKNYRVEGRKAGLVSVTAGLGVVLCLLLIYEGRTVAGRYRDLGSWRRNPDQFFMHYPGQFRIEHLGSQVQMIRLLKERSSPGDDLFVWGAYSLLYYRTGLTPATRFIVNFPFIAPWGPPAWREQLVNDLSQSPPSFIVISKHDPLPSVTYTQKDSQQLLSNYPQLKEFIHNRYDHVSSLADFVLYQRKRPERERRK